MFFLILRWGEPVKTQLLSTLKTGSLKQDRSVHTIITRMFENRNWHHDGGGWGVEGACCSSLLHGRNRGAVLGWDVRIWTRPGRAHHSLKGLSCKNTKPSIKNTLWGCTNPTFFISVPYSVFEFRGNVRGGIPLAEKKLQKESAL